MRASDEKGRAADCLPACLTFTLLVKKALTHFNSIQAREGTERGRRAVGKYARLSSFARDCWALVAQLPTLYPPIVRDTVLVYRCFSLEEPIWVHHVSWPFIMSL